MSDVAINPGYVAAPRVVAASPGGIEAEIAEPARLATMDAQWRDLLSRAETPNVFMDPALAAIAGELDARAGRGAIIAWKRGERGRELAGVWSYAIGWPTRSILPINVLRVPAFANSYLSTPVIDRDRVEETLDAMLDCVAADPWLPKIIALDMFRRDCAVNAALVRVLEKRGSRARVFSESRRPRLESTLDGKAYLEKAMSSSTRKKLRQHRRRLGEKGAISSLVVSTPEAVAAGVEEFLAMEAAGWKGKRGTALASDAANAAFMRGVMDRMSRLGRASIHSLRVDDRPVSIQLVLRSGRAAYTWKTAYDEAYRDYSPGILLLEDYTGAFLSDESVDFVDSCAFDETSFMASWTERQDLADLWIDARRGGSPGFGLLCGLQASFLHARGKAKAAWLRWRDARKRKGTAHA